MELGAVSLVMVAGSCTLYELAIGPAQTTDGERFQTSDPSLCFGHPSQNHKHVHSSSGRCRQGITTRTGLSLQGLVDSFHVI